MLGAAIATQGELFELAQCSQVSYDKHMVRREELMTVLHVHDVPATLYERLRRRAETQRRSLSAEAITAS